VEKRKGLAEAQMKLAVFADLHGNIQGARTVVEHIERWQPDCVVCAGDVINRGPCSKDCLDLVLQKQRELGWETVFGNHEEYVIARSREDKDADPVDYELYQPSRWVFNQIGRDVSHISSWAFSLCLTAPDESEIRVTHASMLGTRNGVFRQTSDEDLRNKIGASPPKLFVVAHTHQPLVRSLDNVLVVNTGSAGMPFDGDLRASYAQLLFDRGEWRAKIVRLEYDRAAAEKDFFDSGFIDEAGPLARIMLWEFRQARGYLFEWQNKYEPLIRASSIALEVSVDEYLSSHGLEK
jgi:putative phosphoesterase